MSHKFKVVGYCSTCHTAFRKWSSARRNVCYSCWRIDKYSSL